MPSRLKSLELQGYKTFATRTVFEFASAVTAIVGPNGSGKSNVADSLRWVLGEQSYSLLRGKKTEDMIFSGSEHRTRAGMASATIVFDNSDGWLPIDFAEVAITRRAYRDGENEYLLNGQKVRLRDVSELLAQSGLAERTYTVIGQGLVDAALALKAEERRRLFEEAAGIGLHRSRREEALKRLEATKRNLERVEDILAELQPRLRSLERQSRRAQEYDQVKADLRLQLRDWYGFHWHRSQLELTEAREAGRVQEDALAKARDGQSGLDEKLEVSGRRIQELRLRLGGWHRQTAELHSQRENLSRDLAVSDERRRALDEQRRLAQEELSRLDEELLLHRERAAAAAEEEKQLAAEQSDARREVDAARKALQSRQAERLEAEKQVQAARQHLSGLTARQAHLQARQAERQSQADRQKEALAASASAVAEAEKAQAAADKALQQAAQALKEAQAARQQADQAVQAHRQRLSAAESARREAAEARSQRDTEAARLRAQLEVLQQAEKSLTGYDSGARLLIEAARQKRLQGTRGALSSYLEVPAEIETAIAAALGQFVDAVLLESGAGPDDALALLEGQPARAALLPLGDISVQAAPEMAQDIPGVIGVAAGMVKAPAELEPVIRLLLGNVLVVQDRKTARRLLAGSQNKGAFHAVTLQGEMFYASGQILAGVEGKPGTLSRPRQRKELQSRLEEVDGLARELDGRLAELKTKIGSLQKEGEHLADQARKAAAREEELRQVHRQADLNCEKAQRQAAWQHEQVGRLEQEITRLNAENASMAKELSALEAEIETARHSLREQNGRLAGLALDEFQVQLSHWQTRAAVAEQAAAEAQKRLAERQSTLEQAVRRQTGLERRIAETEAAEKALEDGKGTLRQNEAQVSVQIEALRVEIEPAEAELNAAEAEQAVVQSQAGQARQFLSAAEHRHAQAKITLARRQEALEGLQRRIEDDFGLVSYDYAEDISGPTPLPLDGMVEQLPKVSVLPADIEENIKRQRAQLRRMGPVNPEAQVEYEQVKERFAFLKEQVADLKKAEADVREIIGELDLLMEREFRKTFDAVAHEFREIFTRLFGGGTARLILTDPEDMTNTGIDIEARLPGRRSQGLSLLSGGERSLTATALVFSLLKVSPTPFCVLDEVDAMLDEANVGRFRDLLHELSQATQFVVVTHNRNTVQVADIIYGVTMGRDSTSQVISLRLDEVAQVVKQIK